MPSTHHWLTHNVISKLLSPIARLYGGVVAARLGLYRWGLLRSTAIAVPVVVVGNVVAGGVGKTPIVISLVKRLQQQGYTVGVVSRGYGRTGKGCTEITKYSAATEVGDEPVLIHHATQAPVFVASSRVEAAKTLLAHYPRTQVIVSDDGLQHLALARDIEIVVFDERGTGNGLLLPAGPLREAWPRQARSSVHLVLNDVTRQLGDVAINGKGEHVKLTSLTRKRIHALAAIAKPEAFFSMLRDKGLTLLDTQIFPDHAPLTNCRIPIGEDDVLLCTAKDAVKLWEHHPQVLAVALSIELNAAFLKVFDASVKACIDANTPQH